MRNRRQAGYCNALIPSKKPETLSHYAAVVEVVDPFDGLDPFDPVVVEVLPLAGLARRGKTC